MGSKKNDLDCATIVHETRHLLGLVDEYQETDTGYKTDPKTGEQVWVESGAQSPGYDCRAQGPRDSVMSNQVDAYKLNRPFA